MTQDSAGEVPKRLKGAVSKTARRCESRMGSNPVFSARQKNNFLKEVFLFDWFDEEVAIHLS